MRENQRGNAKFFAVHDSGGGIGGPLAEKPTVDGKSDYWRKNRLLIVIPNEVRNPSFFDLN
jgi:hypothetical protein